MTLDRPWLLILFALTPLFIWAAMHSRARLSARRGALSAALRVGAFVALVLSLAGLGVGGSVRAPAVFAIDTSESVLLSEQANAFDLVDFFVRGFGADTPVGVVQFAGRAAVLAPPGRLTSAPPPRAGLEGRSSDVGAGLAAALSLVPAGAGGNVVLISDGNATTGGVAAVLQEAVARAVPVSVAPVRSLRGADLAVSALHVPTDARLGAPLRARIGITSGRLASARLRVWDGNRLLSDSPVSIEPGARDFAVDLGGLAPGFHRLRAELLEDADLQLANNVAEAFVRISPPGTLLSIDSSPGDNAAAETLRDLGFQVTSVDPQGARAAELEDYDAVLITNLAAGALGEPLVRRLHAYVRSGHGLAVVGGPDGFAAGGYDESLLDEVLPVWSDPTGRRPEARLALVLAIDKSSSMMIEDERGVRRMDLAVEAAVEAIELLEQGDILGVLGFDSEAQWVVPPRPLGDAADLSRAIDRVRGLQVGDATDIFNAMRSARSRLLQTEASIKHVVLLTDGKSRRGDFEGLTRDMRRRDITVSTIALGDDADQELLERIALLGEGRFYYAPAASDIPRVLTQETRVAGEFAVVEREFQPRMVNPSPILSGVLQGLELPRLHGFVRTRAKPTAEVVLAADSNEPLLAQWQFGRGRALAWTSDGGARWAARWAGWSAFPTFLGQAMAWVMPAPGDVARTGLAVDVEVRDGRGRIVIDSVDAAGRFRNGLSTAVRLIGPDGSELSLTAPAAAPGRYQVETPALAPGVYEVVVEQRAGSQLVASTRTGLVAPAGAELSRPAPDLAFLRRIAAATGGSVIESRADLAALAARADSAPKLDWVLLLTVGLLLYTCDVGVRRLRGTPREILARVGERVGSLRAGVAVWRRLRVFRPARR